MRNDQGSACIVCAHSCIAVCHGGVVQDLATTVLPFAAITACLTHSAADEQCVCWSGCMQLLVHVCDTRIALKNDAITFMRKPSMSTGWRGWPSCIAQCRQEAGHGLAHASFLMDKHCLASIQNGPFLLHVVNVLHHVPTQHTVCHQPFA